jgi:hypothetical protein
MSEKKVVKKCVILSPEQDQKIRQIQIRRMTAEAKTVSYSSILQAAISEGLERLQ